MHCIKVVERIPMKKRSEAMQTLHTGCKADPKIFTQPQTPFPGAQDGQNLISWRWSLPSPSGLHLQIQFGEDQCMQFQFIVVTHPQTNTESHKHTNRQGQLQYTTPLSLARSVISTQISEVFRMW